MEVMLVVGCGFFGPNSFFMSSGTMFDMTAGGWIQKSADGKSSIIATGSAPGLRFFTQTGNTAGSVITQMRGSE